MGKIEENRQKLLQGIDSGALTPIESQVKPNPSGLPGPVDTKNPVNTPFLRSSIPANFQLGTDTFRAFQKVNLPGVRTAPMPASFDKNITAAAKSQVIISQNTGNNVVFEVNNNKTASQNLVNLKNGTGMLITSDAFGGITFTASATGDGLTHGTLPWELDPSYFLLREDFIGVSEAATNALAKNVALGTWVYQGTSSSVIGGVALGAPPNMGYFWSSDVGTINSGIFLTPNVYASSESFTYSNFNSSSVNQYPDGAFALLENPGWQATFIFKADNPRGVGAFSATNMCAYVGLFGTTLMPAITGATFAVNRPDTFIGVRYDTYATQGPFSMTSVAAHSGNTTVYTGTVANPTRAIGQTYVVTGFTNSANNGTFVCTAAGATTMTLTNPAGVVETHAGTITQVGTAGGDTFYVLEAVNNAASACTQRNNTQGTTLVTSIAATAGTWHRLDIVCSTAGQVVITLDGTATLTATVPQTVITGTSTWLTGVISNNFLTVSWTSPGGAPIQPAPPTLGMGSIFTLTGFSSSWAPLNASFVCSNVQSSGASSSTIVASIAHAAVGGSQAVNGTVTFYPNLIPGFMFGDNNTVAAGQNYQWGADYCAVIWNPNLGASAPGTINATKSRYFATPSNP